MGIVRVAFLAAMAAGVGDAAMTSTFSRNQLLREAGQLIGLAVRIPVLDEDVLPLDPSELAQT